MKFLSILLPIFVPLVAGLTKDESAIWLRLLSLQPEPAVSQKSNACQLNAQTVTDFVTKNANNPLVLVVGSSSSPNDNFADACAQLLASRNVTVCQLSLPRWSDINLWNRRRSGCRYQWQTILISRKEKSIGTLVVRVEDEHISCQNDHWKVGQDGL